MPGWTRASYGTAEVYDPATGRFSPVGSLPPIDRAAIAAAGVNVPTSDPSWTQIGTLVALPDGGALLVGHSDEWKHEGSVTRSFRFDAPTRELAPGRPGQRGRQRLEGRDVAPDAGGRPGGRLRRGASRRARARGRGHHLYNGTDSWEKSRVARLYDPATDTWSSLPLMPTGRQGGMTIALADGSVLLIGGNESSTDSDAATAVRFAPSP